jgi:hypothetical protein
VITRIVELAEREPECRLALAQELLSASALASEVVDLAANARDAAVSLVHFRHREQELGVVTALVRDRFAEPLERELKLEPRKLLRSRSDGVSWSGTSLTNGWWLGVTGPSAAWRGVAVLETCTPGCP